jgi:hypothetical protein
MQFAQNNGKIQQPKIFPPKILPGRWELLLLGPTSYSAAKLHATQKFLKNNRNPDQQNIQMSRKAKPTFTFAHLDSDCGDIAFLPSGE